MKKRKKKYKIIKKHNHPFPEVERAVDKAVPYLLILLAIVLILDNPLWTLFSLEHYEAELLTFDTIVIIFLVADLVFKWWHVRNVKAFVRFYWLELIAVFPFYLFFRIYVFGAEILKAGEEAQRIFHEALLAREAALLREARFIAEGEKVLREARPFIRGLRSFARFIRVIALRFRVAYHNLVKASLRHR